MENTLNQKSDDFIKNEVVGIERRMFNVRIILIALGYAIMTLGLNAIRATAPLWLVWPLIIVQFTLYFSIFISSYRRAIVCGLNKNIGLIIFTALAILARVNDWELAIIPLTVIIMIIVSMKTKNVSDGNKHLLPNHMDK